MKKEAAIEEPVVLSVELEEPALPPEPAPPAPPALPAAQSGAGSWLDDMGEAMKEVSSSVSRELGAAWSSMSNVLGSGDTADAVRVSMRVSEDSHIHLDIKAVDDAAVKPSLLPGLDAVLKRIEPKATRKDDELFNDAFPEDRSTRSTAMVRFKQRPYLLGFC